MTIHMDVWSNQIWARMNKCSYESFPHRMVCIFAHLQHARSRPSALWSQIREQNEKDGHDGPFGTGAEAESAKAQATVKTTGVGRDNKGAGRVEATKVHAKTKTTGVGKHNKGAGSNRDFKGACKGKDNKGAGSRQ